MRTDNPALDEARKNQPNHTLTVFTLGLCAGLLSLAVVTVGAVELAAMARTRFQDRTANRAA